MPAYLMRKLWKGKKRIKQGDDFFVLITGKVGDGKSTLGIQIGAVMGLPFGLKNVHFKPKLFLQSIQTTINQTHDFDEAITGLMSRRALSTMNKDILQAFVQCRSRRHCIIICLPTPYLLEWYVMDRVHLWIHVYKYRDATGTKRKGAMQIFPEEHILKWYEKGKRSRTVILPKGSMGKCRFPKHFPLDQQGYEDKKLAAQMEYLNEHGETKSVLARKWKRRLGGLSKWVQETHKLTQGEIAKIISDKSGLSTDKSEISRSIGLTVPK